jgi:predicted membrane metal-binding protein
LTQYAVTISLLLLKVLLFGRISLIGPFANALAVPMIGLAVMPLALTGSVLPAPLSRRWSNWRDSWDGAALCRLRCGKRQYMVRGRLPSHC